MARRKVTPPISQPNWDNRTLFHLDNLEVLRGMNSNSVDLIATDPPFKKGRDFHAKPTSISRGARFQDRWSWEIDVHKDWLNQIQDDWSEVWEVVDAANAIYMKKTKANLSRPRDEVGSDMGAFLCFMAVRLIEMRRILKPTGAIYLHCDHTASHYLKAIMDAIFGTKNFRNEIVWCYGAGGSSKKQFPRKHDVILFYSKGNRWTFNYEDKGLRVPYSQITLDMHYTKRDEDGRLYRIQKGKYKTYADEGKLMPDYWTDIGGQTATSPIMKEYTSYPTQKPLALYERIITASSNPHDVVLDPFCGCATTCIAAEKLNRQWVGIDIWEGAHEVVLKRLKKECNLAGPDGGAEGRLFTDGDLLYRNDVPVKTEQEETSGPMLFPIYREAKKPWEELDRQEVRALMAKWQTLTLSGLVVCAGCGRELEKEFMQLDHITPRKDRGSNFIDNRIFMCGPCNRRKKQNLTISGLHNANRQCGWMVDQQKASDAKDAVDRGINLLKHKMAAAAP